MPLQHSPNIFVLILSSQNSKVKKCRAVKGQNLNEARLVY